MSSLNLTLPVNLEPVKTADARVNTAFTAIQTWGNGNIEAENLAAATAKSAGLNRGSEKVKGASIVATEQESTSATFASLTTPDEVTVTLPAEGLLIVSFHALVRQNGSGEGTVGLFIGSNQAKTGGSLVEVKQSGSTEFGHCATAGYNLVAEANTEAAKADVTTGQVMAVPGTSGGTSTHQGPGGGALEIFATAGTYAVSVQYKTTANKIAAKNRRLYVLARSYT